MYIYTAHLINPLLFSNPEPLLSRKRITRELMAVRIMSLTRSMGFSCPYCMAPNEVEIDEITDVGQVQVLDCQVCCQPIELRVFQQGDDIDLEATCENE